MKTLIFYFTGTGNCLKAARDLAAQLKDAQIISMPKAVGYKVDPSVSCIGLVFPVYIFGMPLLVSDFIKKLDVGKGKYIFAIATCGGMAANTLLQTEKEFSARGLRLSAGFLLKMPGNYTPLYEAIPDEKQNAMFTVQEQRIKEIADIIKNGQQYPMERHAPKMAWLFSGLYKVGAPRIPQMDKDYWSDEKCNSCGICAQVCPVNNIEMAEGRPKWLHKCEQCMACLQWCPQEAIQCKKSTIGRKRYKNPQVSVQDIISSSLTGS